MSDEQQRNEQQAEPLPPVPLTQALGFGASTFLAAGVVDLAAHLGLTGLVVGGIAAYAASRHGPELYEHVREALPSRSGATAAPPAARTAPTRQRTSRSTLDRALGRFPKDDLAATAHEDTAIWLPDDDDYKRLVPEEDVEHWMRRPASSARDLLDLAPGVPIHQRDLAGKAIFVCGIRRHGKTTLGVRIAEQLGKHYLPLFIPDLEGDYLSLADVLPRAVIAGHSDAAGLYRADEFAALDSSQAAFQLGYDLLDVGYQVILDLSSYAVLDQAIAMQINVIRGLFHWTNTHPAGRVPCHVYLDEAQRYLPQTLSDSVIQDRTVLGMLLKCYMDIIASGGKRGLAPVILTQRFAQVNNKIMAQSEVFFLLRQTHDTDLQRCMEYVSAQVATKEQIARFAPGQGVYIAADGTQVVTQFKQRESSGERSATPQAEAAWRYASLPMQRPGAAAVPVPTPATMRRLPTMAEEDRAAAAPLLPLATPEPVRYSNQSGQQEATPPVRNRPKTELERVLEAYRDNPFASYRELGEKLGMGKDKVGELIRELRERGMIKHEQS